MTVNDEDGVADASRLTPLKSRGPAPISQARLLKLSVLPLFYKLSGQRVAIAGSSRAAAWKVELLAATGAQVDVYGATPDAQILAVASQASNVCVFERHWSANDFAKAVLVIAEAEEEDEAIALQQAAAVAGAHLNIIDKPQWSSFQFGSIVERSPLVIGISTDGGAPVFAQSIRARLETLLPDGLRNWASAAKAWRPRVTSLGLDIHARRKIWEKFTRLALAEPGRVPADHDFASLVEGVDREPAASAKTGIVMLVGAGPGDPELLTLRAVRALQSADVVLFDDLVSQQVLDLARRESDKISVGKRGFKPSCTQEDICDLMISLAREGKYVVRLKGGDPMVFGRANEEIAALEAVGIPVSVVPGVTAASAAAASLGISLTERNLARRLQFVTAHARGGLIPDDLNWRALADPLATTIVYMGVRTLPEFCARLVREGLSADMPAVMVERASQPDERHFAGTLTTLPGIVANAGVKGPALTIIGPAALDRRIVKNIS